MLQRFETIVLLFALFSSLGCRSQTEPTGGANERSGAEVYKTYCSGCHGADGLGTRLNLGPSLAKLRPHWDATKLEAYLLDPQAYAARDERLGGRQMPALAADVSKTERAALVEHTLSLMVD